MPPQKFFFSGWGAGGGGGGGRRSTGLKEDTEGRGGCFPEVCLVIDKVPCQMNIKRQSPFSQK